jgi:hypothetical protein
MYLKKTKNFINSKRFEVKIFYLKKIFKFKKSYYLKFLKNKNGKCSITGKTIVYSKTRSNKKRFFFNNYFFKKIFYNTLYFLFEFKKNKNKIIAMLKNFNNQFISLPLINGIFLGDYFYFFFKNNKSLQDLGNMTFLLFANSYFFLSNISD